MHLRHYHICCKILRKLRCKSKRKMQVELPQEKYQNGEIKSPPGNDFSNKLEQAIETIVKKEGFLQYHIEKQCISTNGGNYLALLYKIDVTGKTKEGKKELHLFVKNMVDPEALKSVLSVTEIYKTELFAYKELSKIFDELQESAKVPMGERYKMVKVYEESNSETIIMENLAKKGFTTYYRMEVASLEFVKLAVKKLAQFHGLSFVLKEKRPEYFDSKIKSKKTAQSFNEDWPVFVKSMRDIVVKYVDKEFEDKIEKVYLNLLTQFEHNMTDETIAVCLCHGDYRPNNILTKFDNGAVKELIPVDYQLMYYGCPVMDFLYLIYTSTDRDLRKEHLSYLKDLYYETLGNLLGYFDIDVEAVYPRNEFETVYKDRLDHGLLVVLLVYPFIYASEDDIPDLSENKVEQPFQVDGRIKDRLRGVIEDFLEWGYL